MAKLLAGSKLMRDEAAGDRGHRSGKLIQDRYSLRCLPQFLGPIIDGLAVAAGQIEVEANCANDNPLIDPDSGRDLSHRQFPGAVHRRGDGQRALPASACWRSTSMCRSRC